MKTKVLTVGLFLATMLSLPAAPDAPKFEVRANSVDVTGQTSVFKGSAVVVIGDMRVSADQMIYDQSSGVLKCMGETRIEMPGRLITGTEVTIDMKEKKFTIRAARVTLDRLPDR